jgi:hypothetical protein
MFEEGQEHGLVAPPLSHIVRLNDRLDLVGRRSVIGRTISHRLNEGQASLRCVVLQCCAIHSAFIESECIRYLPELSRAPAVGRSRNC